MSESALLSRVPALARLGESFQSRVPYVAQVTPAECGVACLAMVLRLHGRNVAREDVREVLGAGRDGASAKDILDAAAWFGLRGTGLKVDVDELEALPRGTILHWGMNHFVVLEAVRRHRVEVVDPGLGRRTVAFPDVRQSFTGVALLLEPGPAFRRSGESAVDTRRGVPWDLVLRSGEWTRIFVTSLFLQVLLIALPVVTSAIVDQVIPRSDYHLLFVVATGLAVTVAFEFAASVLRAHLILNLRISLEANMSVNLFEHLLSLPLSFFQKRPVGDLAMRLNSNVIVREILSGAALSALLDGALVTLYLIGLLAINPHAGALVLVLGALEVAMFFALRGRLRDADTRFVEKRARFEAYQQEVLAGSETLKAMGCERRATEQWSQLLVEASNASLEGGRLSAWMDAASGTLRVAAPLFVFAAGTFEVLAGRLTLGAMLAVNALAAGVFTPLSSLFGTAVQLQRLTTYFDRIDDIRCAKAEPGIDEGKRPAKNLAGGVEVRNVSFRYSHLGPLVLDGVSAVARPGEFIAIVGRSGSGKSSLASLLAALQTPESGEVFYDGVPLAEYELRSVRRQLGVVSQRAYVFGGTIRANISIADPSLAMDAIVAAAKMAQLHEDVCKMPMGYDTVLSDGGGSLSGGQRQRVALARALATNPRILVLDEATSALDVVTEAAVERSLAALQCTRIVVAHRLSTIARAHRIYVMDAGRIVQVGTHAELSARSGVYRELAGAPRLFA